MKLRTVALVGAVGWAYSKLPRDPHQWPGFAGEQYAALREQIEEAVEAGKRASDRRIAQLDREVEEAFTSGTAKRP